MATPPTFSSYAEVADWQVKSTTARTVAGVSWSANDDIYVIGGTGDGGTTFTGVPTATGLTFTQIAFVSGGTSAGTTNYLWLAHAASGGSAVTVSSSTLSGAADNAGIAVLVVSGSDGAGTPVTGFTGTSESLSLTRGFANSGVLFASFDWTAESPAPTAWTPAGFTQRTATSDGASYGIEIATWGDQGAAGTASYGQTGTTTSGKWSKIVVEIKGAAAAAASSPAVLFSPMSEHPFDGLTAPWDLRSTQPPIPMAVWSSEPSTAVPAAAELGTGVAAAAATAVEKKVAVQGGSCTAGAAAAGSEKKVAVAASVAAGAGSVSATEKKIAVQAGLSSGAAAAVAVEKRVAPQAGSAQGAAAGVATEVRVAAQSGSCTAAAAGTAVYIVGVPPPNADDPTQQAWYALFPPINDVLREASEWQPGFVRVVWFGQDAITVPTAVETGTTPAGPAATAVEKKVAVQGGSCAAGAAGAAGEKRVAPERGVSAAAAATTSVETSGSVAIERGTAAAAAAATASEKKVAVQGGSCSAGTTATGASKKVSVERGTSTAGATQVSVCRKVAKATGTNATAPSAQAAQSKKITQAGRLCVAGVASCTTRTAFDSAISRISTGSGRQRASTMANRQRVSTGNSRQRITTEIG